MYGMRAEPLTFHHQLELWQRCARTHQYTSVRPKKAPWQTLQYAQHDSMRGHTPREKASFVLYPTCSERLGQQRVTSHNGPKAISGRGSKRAPRASRNTEP